ncbi:hypothetical protein WME89_34565 [Sorangium sp. So ce321]|uniref:hypothetical protein n=1 Tax=Sorangium sp. So ce321 TaxID=3133300 RepID=UPI003F632075
MPKKQNTNHYDRWHDQAKAAAQTENPLKVPYDAALEEAGQVAGFINKHWEPTGTLPGLKRVRAPPTDGARPRTAPLKRGVRPRTALAHGRRSPTDGARPRTALAHGRRSPTDGAAAARCPLQRGLWPA